MSQCYDFQKWSIKTLASVAIILIIGLVSPAYGQNYSNQTDYGGQLKERIQKAAKEYFEHVIERGISNATGLPFDLHKNYTQEEIALIKMKLIVHICENRPDMVNQTDCVKELKAEALK